jgi:DNA-binding transcriptional MerR regulator
MVVVVTRRPADVVTAAAAAAAAGITYRQLDHWARQGWVVPTVVEETGRRTRWYGPLDVARLATLRHLARCGFDVGTLGAAVGQLELRPGMVVVAGGDPEEVAVVATDDVVKAVRQVGRWSVFDPTDVLSAQPDANAADLDVRRSA